MAEQIRHNVVNELESASASAPVDVVSSTSISASAAHGDIRNDVVFSHLKNAGMPFDVVNLVAPFSSLDAAAVNHKADPSAGHVSADTTSGAASSLRSAGNEIVNGAQEQGRQGEGSFDDRRSSTPDGSVDNSVPSDVEMARGDTSEQQKGTHHHRTNSVKKPATFSKVSATKTFLAKSLTPVAGSAKAGEKPVTVGTLVAPVARPRLVAKSGSGLQSIQKARTGSESVGGPDASKVWNKNRPVAPAPAKHLTDEELKQQYGIHLATRLQSDETGKDSKWADIDDDEDDWAPEAVVWMDGTKSSLAPAEPEPEIEPKQVPAPPAKAAEPTKPDLSNLKKATITDTGPPKTILKPGIAAQQAKQQSIVVAPTGAEKPTLKAKSPAPAPVKSPWAPIPPVSAMPITLPIQPQQAPIQTHQMVSQDARAYEASMPAAPAREIAADTFDRSWREGEGGSRELFNSANGRYEPAPEGRRSSVKQEGPSRKPAVLQRPLPGGTTPAEPSVAFQARNGSQIDGTTWQRRRGSSTSQGNNLAPGRRMSVSSKVPDQQTLLETSDNNTTRADTRNMPSSLVGEAERASFSQSSPWDQQMPAMPAQDSKTPMPAATTAPVSDAEDPVKIQERVMKEKRELAKKRKLEEEARMEQEKQQRLKARLAALEGAGKSRKEREAEAASVLVATPIVEQPVQAQTITATSEGKSTSTEPRSAPLGTMEPSAALSHIDVVDKADSAEELVAPTSLRPEPTTAPPAERSEISQRQTPRAHLSPRANVRAPFGQQSAAYKQPTSSYSSPGERKSQPFGASRLAANDSFSSWVTSGPGLNVWGSSGIGNGTFENSNSFAPLQQGSALPPPPGMNRISPPSFPQDSRSPSLQHQQLADQQRTFAPPPGMDTRQENTWGQPRGNGVSRAPGFGHQTNLPSPIGPPSRGHQQQHSPAHVADQWQKTSHYMPVQYQEEIMPQMQKDIVDASPQVIKETFKQTSGSSKLGGPRRYAKPEYTIHEQGGSRRVSALSPAPPNAQTQPSGPFSTPSPLSESRDQASTNHVRIPDGSLNPAHGGLPVRQPPIAPPITQKHIVASYQGTNFPTGPLAPIPESGDLSPPPPEVSSYVMNAPPTVRLPLPPPIVKLPPAVLSSPVLHNLAVAPPGPRQPQHHAWGPNRGRPIVMDEAWQARFNGLFQRAPIQTEVPPSPPKTPPKAQDLVLAIASSSKTQWSDAAAHAPATVSLPLSQRLAPVGGLYVDGSTEVTSKATIDSMFHEELSFGSLPKVGIPRNPWYNRMVYAHTPQHNMLKFQYNSKLHKAVEAQSKEQLDTMDIIFKHKDGYFLKIPGTKLKNKMVKHVGSVRKMNESQHAANSSRKRQKIKDQKDKPVLSTDVVTAGARSANDRKRKPSASPAVKVNNGKAETGKKRGGWAVKGEGQDRNSTSSTIKS